MGRRQHDHRGTHGSRSDPAAQVGARAGYRRISAQQDRGVMKIFSSTNVRAGERLLKLTTKGDRKSPAAVSNIVSAVRTKGDAALLAYARRFDRLDESLEVSKDEIEELSVRVPPRVRAAIAAAAKNIEKVARKQRPKAWTVTTAPGV